MGKHTGKQRFSIRKYTFGAGSVLIGLSLSFTIHSTKVEAAETVSDVQSNIGHVTDSGKNDDKQGIDETKENSQLNTQETANEHSQHVDGLIDEKQEGLHETTNEKATFKEQENSPEKTNSEQDVESTGNGRDEKQNINTNENYQEVSAKQEETNSSDRKINKNNNEEIEENAKSEVQNEDDVNENTKSEEQDEDDVNENTKSEEQDKDEVNENTKSEEQDKDDVNENTKSEEQNEDEVNENTKSEEQDKDDVNENTKSEKHDKDEVKENAKSEKQNEDEVQKIAKFDEQDELNEKTGTNSEKNTAENNEQSEESNVINNKITADRTTEKVTTANNSAPENNTQITTKEIADSGLLIKSDNTNDEVISLEDLKNKSDEKNVVENKLKATNLKTRSLAARDAQVTAVKNAVGDTTVIGGKDVNDLIKVSNVKYADGTWTKGKAYPISFDLDIPNEVKRNDYFEVKMPKELKPTSTDRDNGILLGENESNIYAKGTYSPDNNSFIFKFTDNAEKYKDRKVNVSLMQIVNFKTTLKSGNYNLELKVGNQIFENTKTIAFSSDASTSNVFQETEVKEKKEGYHPYNTTYTINAKNYSINNANIKLTPYVDNSKSPNTISQFNKNDTNITIYKVNDATTLNESGSAEYVDKTDVTSQYKPVFNTDGTISIGLKNISSPYIIVVDSKTSKPFVAGTFIESKVNLSGSNISSMSNTNKVGKAAPSTSNSSGVIVSDTTPPTVDKITNQTKEVNTAIDSVTINAKDDSGKPVRNDVYGLPDGVTYDPSTNTISGSPKEVGDYKVTIITSDSTYNETITEFTITVTDTTAPTVEAIPDQEKEVNTPIDTITIKGEDNSGKPVTNEVSGLPEGVTYDPETSTISGSPTEVGEYPVTVVTTDANGNKTETTFTITVTDKTAPTVEAIPDQEKEVNTPIDTITIKGEDNSGKPVTNEVSGLPEGVTYDPETSTISGSPTEVGEYPVTVVTTDANGNKTETTFTITVTDKTAPTVENIPDQEKEVNTPIDSITIQSEDNSGKPVTNEVSGLPEGVTYDPETSTISGSPTEVGEYPVTVVTTDANGNKTETTFTITVTDKTAPTVEAIPDQEKEVNTPIDTITIKGEDNSGKPVTNEVSGLPEGVTYDPETSTISGSPTEVGEYPVTVVTTDANGNKTETTFTITVTDKTAPTVEAIPDQEKEVNTPIDTITIKGEDNSGKPVTNEVSGLPEGVTYDPETSTISGSPTEVGEYPVTVVTTDANGNKTETTFTITVTDKTAPTVEAIPDQEKEVNTPIDTITIKGEDNSGKPVTNEVSGLPEGVTYDPETSTISGSPTEVGEYPVTVVTTDANGNKTETTFTITVTDKTAPTVEAIPDQEKEVNTPIDTITIKGEDNSGKPVTNEVSGLPEGVTYDPETSTISGSPTEVGEYPVTVVTTDANGNKTETTFTITVTDTTAPTVENIPDQEKEVNTPIDSITIQSEDNSGKPVTNEVSGLPEGVTFDPETNTINGSPSEVGEYRVTVVTTDVNGNKTETTFTITVTDTTAPTVENIPDQEKEVNTPIDTITIKGEDNSGKPVTNEVSGLPEGVTYDPETSTISGSPTEVGEYPVTVVTTDANGNKTETTFTITVTDKTAPTVENIPDQEKEVNTPIDSITIQSEDNSGKPVTNEVSGLPEGVTYDPETSTISGSPTEVGEYPVTVVTTDANGNKTETTFTITVTPKGSGKLGMPSESGASNESHNLNTQEENSNHNVQDNASNQDKKTSNNKKQALPKTGKNENNNATLLGSILAAIAGILLLGRRKKKQ
ncbi:cell wall associated biofilm protein [Staphylococcus saprophyticus]|uniref:putative Ig domain-containing protein n=1 Tax=Staphylococcus saprophyticus TaxID=29385 RepID=UPI000DFE019B|nr:putative Ig domain-containing protein [Staphylococcus saprophyticus]SUM66311.1 cell wall associated biofilm protein [Staphylococcus saprophyticus]